MGVGGVNMYAGGLEVVYRDERGINAESQPT